jgi:hypothetical protein
VRFRRLTVATLACTFLVLGVSVLLGSGRAQGSSSHTCSAPDKQFIQTVRSNMDQLAYWSDELTSDDVTPAIVIQQARSEAAQIAATGPTDPTLTITRKLVRTMLIEYSRGIYAKFHNSNAGVHMQLAYTLANSVHDQLVGAEAPLAARGCDVAPLLAS